MKKTVLTLEIGTRIISFPIWHNLEHFGVDVKKVFNKWATMRHTLTPEMFCRYIMMRSDEFICLTEKKAKFLNLEA